MDRYNGCRIACYLVAITLSTSLPIVAHSEEVRSVRPQVAPAVESVQPQAGLAGPAVPPVHSTCTPNYCGIIGQSLFLAWNYPTCGADCGTERWYVKGLPSKLATYTLSRTTTTGKQFTRITFKISHSAPLGFRGNIQIGANCSGSIKCVPNTVYLYIFPAKPVNFHQDGLGWATLDGGLHFNYIWGSTSGYKEDLKDCMVGEIVTYPGSGSGYKWPDPPWYVATHNPTIIWAPATVGAAHDDHYPHPEGSFVKPYVAKAFNANQDYRYQCKGGNGSLNFPGYNGLIIARKVSDTTGRGCFVYTVTKSGGTTSSASASIRLPGLKISACQPLAKVNVSQRLPDFKNSSDEIGMSVSLPGVSVGLNAPIFFDLKVFNRTAGMVGLDLGLNRKANLEVAIWDQAGGVTTRMLSSAGFGGSGEVSLAPKEAFAERLLLNEWYGFRQTGTYHIRVTLLDGSSVTSGTANANRPSTEFSVQIGPRNPAQLERVSQGLAGRAIAATSLEENMAAANALSYVLDPVAIPSLVRVLQHGSLVERYAVDGLGRIGSSEAIAALVAAQNHPDKDVRAAVRSTLDVLQGRVQGAVGPAD